MTKVAAVVGIAVLMVLVPMTGVIGATPTSGQMQLEDVSLANDEYEYEVTEDVSVWEGSPVSLRADLEEAPTTVQLHTVQFQTPDGITGDANLKDAGVFDTGEIPLDLEDSTGPPISDYANEDVKLIVGKLDSEATIEDQEMFTSFDSQGMDELNDNVDFEVIESTDLDEDGELSEIYDAGDSGQYISLVATTDEEGNGMDVTEQNLEVTGETTILGVGGFLVQDESSDVDSPSSVEPGDSIEFEADNIDTDASGVEHGVALYHEDTFMDQVTTIEVAEEPDSDDFSEEDIQIKSSLEGVDGVATIDEDSNLMGFTQDLDNKTGQVDFESVLGLSSDQVDFDGDHEDADAILDASATVQQEDPSDKSVEINVETLEDWEEGDYQWIHVAADTDEEILKTDEGTVSIEEESGGGGGGDDGDDDDDSVIPSAEIDITPKSPSVNEDVTFSGSDSSIRDSSDTDGITDYEWDIDGETFSGEEVTTSFDAPGDYAVELTVTSAEGETDTASRTVTIQSDGGDDDDGVGGDGGDGDTGDGDTGDGDDTDSDDDGDGVPGFGAVVAFIALLSSALVVTRVRR